VVRLRAFARKHRTSLLACAGGLVCALATPPFDLYPALFVGLAVLAYVVEEISEKNSLPPKGGGSRRGASTRRIFLSALWHGTLWGTFGQLVGLSFVPSVIQMFTPLGTAASWLAHALLAAAQSLAWGAAMALVVLLRRKLGTPLELAFGAGILLVSLLPALFPWTLAGLVTPWPALVQLAELVGERGVSVLLAVAAALLARGARAALEREGRARVAAPFAAAGLVVAALLAHGAWAITRVDAGADHARIALVQAAVDPHERWERQNWPSILGRLKNQTASAEAAGVDLTIWPEAAYPYALPRTTRAVPRGERQILGGAVRGPILFGLITLAPPDKRPDGTYRHDKYNSATIVRRDGRMQEPVDKVELLAFGEAVPLGEHVRWLRDTFAKSGAMIAGKDVRALRLERNDGAALEMAVLNCYEDTLPALGRRVLRELSPNLLVNVTNDAWFVGTQAPELHLRLSAMRAIELRRDLVRAVNLGPAAWIDAAGRVRARRDGAEPGYLVVEPALRSAPLTLYARWGDLPLALVLVALIAARVVTVRLQARNQGSSRLPSIAEDR
jgi:apolipoprotein N-acyltransferase